MSRLHASIIIKMEDIERIIHWRVHEYYRDVFFQEFGCYVRCDCGRHDQKAVYTP